MPTSTTHLAWLWQLQIWFGLNFPFCKFRASDYIWPLMSPATLRCTLVKCLSLLTIPCLL
jgi:hypothetical protein